MVHDNICWHFDTIIIPIKATKNDCFKDEFCGPSLFNRLQSRIRKYSIFIKPPKYAGPQNSHDSVTAFTSNIKQNSHTCVVSRI